MSIKKTTTVSRHSQFPGFWEGFASVFGKRSRRVVKHQDDMDAIRGDWNAVGRDLREAMGKCATT